MNLAEFSLTPKLLGKIFNRLPESSQQALSHAYESTWDWCHTGNPKTHIAIAASLALGSYTITHFPHLSSFTTAAAALAFAGLLLRRAWLALFVAEAEEEATGTATQDDELTELNDRIEADPGLALLQPEMEEATVTAAEN